ncbi:hypothetical protein LTR60_002139 [Cryomyces antarcticus]|nr:hypothetical protein LTR60_002139 [Cryomyces antarcticus]
MASAAAVGADASRSPLPNTLGDDDRITGAITSLDEPTPGLETDDNKEDDVMSIPGRKAQGHEDGAATESDEEDEDDLFGDGADEGLVQARKQLDDEDLDSGDDEGRNDRMQEDDAAAAPPENESINFADVEMSRHAQPEPSDGELYLLKVPRFLSVDPVAWRVPAFQPPVTDHHSKTTPSATFSAYNTALTTLRWRHSPSNPSELQSNARILRWSDGSLTFQLASDPTTQYEIDGNPLAPPQQTPVKPTPMTLKHKHKGRFAADGKYHPEQDSFTYLAAPSESASMLRVTNKITAGLSVLPSADTTDDALERLQNSLAAAVRGKNLNGDGGIEFVNINEDPELAKKKAEAAEREKLKMQKRREAAEARERDRGSRVLGRSGLGYRHVGGLTTGMLEDDEFGGGMGRPRANKPKARRQHRRNDEYSSDEDFGRRRTTKEDEYDEEDEFIAKSDEEEVVEDDEDEEEDVDDGIVEKEKTSPKRDRPPPVETDEDAEADGDPGQARPKRRRVVEDDDDED